MVSTSAMDFGHREAATIIHALHKFAPREAEKLRACISTVWILPAVAPAKFS